MHRAEAVLRDQRQHGAQRQQQVGLESQEQVHQDEQSGGDAYGDAGHAAQADWHVTHDIARAAVDRGIDDAVKLPVRQQPDRQHDQLLIIGRIRKAEGSCRAHLGRDCIVPAVFFDALNKQAFGGRGGFGVVGFRRDVSRLGEKAAQVRRMEGSGMIGGMPQHSGGFILECRGSVIQDFLLVDDRVNSQAVRVVIPGLPAGIGFGGRQACRPAAGDMIGPERYVDRPEMRDRLCRFQILRNQVVFSKILAVFFLALFTGDGKRHDTRGTFGARELRGQHHVAAAEAAEAGHGGIGRINGGTALRAAEFRDLHRRVLGSLCRERADIGQ